uniref:Si:dkey-177p2.6 n=1 Tax=Acanthochromis polyacanthus TaxID=80966 RepID=A0A3Q1GNK5_9TELE
MIFCLNVEEYEVQILSMLGRGVKRKWSCLEEDGLLDPSRSDASRLQQRQLVLGLCLEKLQRYHAGVELSLRRSVLLINTLRQIQEEMRSDGVGGCDVHPDSCLLRDDFREDATVTCPGCSEGEAPPELSSQEADGSEQQKPETVSAVGYLGDLALDDIFEDIDTSMYETSDLPSAWASGPLWPLSVSLWPDEDVKLRPQSHSTAGSLQSCLMDLNELDHIMEILVKS